VSKLPWQSQTQPTTFLPREYIQGKQEIRFVALTVSLFVVVMLAVVGAFLVTNRRWAEVREQQQFIATEYEAESSKIEQLKTLESQRDDMLAKARITTALLETAPRSVLLAELVTALPEDATLTNVTLQSKRIRMAPPAAAAQAASKAKSRSRGRGKEEEPAKAPVVLPPRFEYSLKITGVAPTNNEIADYLLSLQQSPLLRAVELSFIERARLEGMDLRRFEIVAELPEDADARRVERAEEVDLEAFVAATTPTPEPGS
jgi:Tfp pilus assembly protein PilN